MRPEKRDRGPIAIVSFLMLSALAGWISGCESGTAEAISKDQTGDKSFLTLLAPKSGDSYALGDLLQIKAWTVKQDIADPVDAVDLMISPDSGKNWGYLRTGSIIPGSPNRRRFPWVVKDSISILGVKSNLVDNPGVCIRAEQYTIVDAKRKFQSGMISIRR